MEVSLTVAMASVFATAFLAWISWVTLGVSKISTLATKLEVLEGQRWVVAELKDEIERMQDRHERSKK
jgi:hypothetical protein